MSSETLIDQRLRRADADDSERDPARDSAMRRRMEKIRDFARRYRDVMTHTGFGSKDTTRETIEWLLKAKPTDNRDDLESIYWREDFMRKSGEQNVKEGMEVHAEFMKHFNRSKPFLSQASQRRWLERFYDTKPIPGSSLSLFQQKRAWIMEHMESYATRWVEVGKKYDDAMQRPAFAAIIQENPAYAVLKNRDTFLDLPYEKRSDLLKEALAYEKAQETMQHALFMTAKSKLHDAATRKVMSADKIGAWLTRIIESKESRKVIQDFVEGRGTNPLDTLIERWAAVKGRYDDAKAELLTRSDETNARGFMLIEEERFLSMHYDDRIRYVEELEERLRASRDIESEHPLMLKIRYAMDVGDWDDAADLHEQAMNDPTIQPRDKESLRRMGKTIEQHASPPSPDSPREAIKKATRGMDAALTMMKKTHPDCFPLALKLSQSLRPNLALKQWRQTVYNNEWCRLRGYFNNHIAKIGASKEMQQRTKELSEQGKDTGMHDSIGTDNASSHNLRSRTLEGEKKSRYRPTYQHCDLTSFDVMETLLKQYNQEQSPKMLYWTTFCPHVKGEPYSEEKMHELFILATELRKHSRVLESNEMMYQGIGKPAIKRGVSLPTASAAASSEASYSTAG